MTLATSPRARQAGATYSGIHPGPDVADDHRAYRLHHQAKKTVAVGEVGALGVLATVSSN